MACGWVSRRDRATSLTGHSRPRSSIRMRRRWGSAIALNASAVVRARAMWGRYIPISENVNDACSVHCPVGELAVPAAHEEPHPQGIAGVVAMDRGATAAWRLQRPGGCDW